MKGCLGIGASLLILILGSFTLAAGDLPPHPEFSADMVMYHKNKVYDEGKFYMGKDAGRMEMQKKMRQTQIFRMDKDVIWMVMDKNKTYMEMKMQYNALVNYRPEGFSESCTAGETIDGHPTQQCHLTGQFMGKKVENDIWKATDLGGVVIRNRDGKGNGNELKNIVRGPQPAELFEPPAGYQKMVMPGGLGDIMKGLTN